MSEITYGSTPTKVSDTNQRRNREMGKAKRKAAPPKKAQPKAQPKAKKSTDKKSTEGQGGFEDMTEEQRATLLASEAKQRAYSMDKRELTDPKTWSVQEDEFGMFCVIDDDDGKVTGKWPSQDQANAQIKVLENEDAAGRTTT